MRARKIPASPCQGIRVTSGEYEADRQVATPVQFLRAALRLDESFGFSGFVLALMDGYTGARWSELAGLQPHEYDEVNRAIRVIEPLAEAQGQLIKAKRPKSPAGKRWVQLPPFLAGLYEGLLDDCDRPFIFVGEKGGILRRSNFGRRFWRPAWDGVQRDRRTGQYVPPILPGFTFHEGRHTHRTWLADDGIPEIGRAARLGQKMRGMGGIYEHVTPETKKRILDVLQARWESSLLALRAQEQARLIALLPRTGHTIKASNAQNLWIGSGTYPPE